MSKILYPLILSRSLLSVLLLFFSLSALSDTLSVAEEQTDLSDSQVSSNVASRLCPNAKLISEKLITDICWGCIFPIRMMGISLGGGTVPEGAAKNPFCLCFDNLGIPEPGFTVGMWEPARIVETVRQAGCSPSLNGVQLPGFNPVRRGGEGNLENSVSEISFFHYHYFSFPLLAMLELFMPTKCFSDGMIDFDLLYLSEVDPTWNNSSLAFYVNPESSAAANIAAQAACTVDAVSSTARQSNDLMWWCAGSWGLMYPLSGHYTARDFLSGTSLLATRAVNALHRRGLAVQTMGKDAMCDKRVIQPFMKKTQYRTGLFYPVAQGNRVNHIGESALRWGAGKRPFGMGDDAVYVLWRWNDCCLRY